MNDVKPESATMNGNILTISRYTYNSEEYLFIAANGGLYYKKLDDNYHGAWKNYSDLPFSPHYYHFSPTNNNGEGHNGQQIIKVLSNEDTLYLLTVEYNEDINLGTSAIKKFHLWAKNLSNSIEWKDLNNENGENDFLKFQYFENSKSYKIYFNIFSTNSPKTEHRQVFLRNDDSNIFYQITGQTKVQITPPTSQKIFSPYNSSDSSSNTIDSAFYIGNKLYFLDSGIVTTNETKDDNATYAYFSAKTSNNSQSYEIWYFDGTNFAKAADSRSIVSSLCATKDYLIIGKGNYSESYTIHGGIEKLSLDDNGKPGNYVSDLSNNAKHQFSSSYILMTLLTADPSKKESESTIYTSITFKGSGSSSNASFDDIGLWSYYPTRGNWNRE